MTVPVLAPPAATAAVSCTYCRAPIPTVSFADLSLLRRLVRATCPGCGRSVEMSRVTLLRLTGSSVPPTRLLVAPVSP
jgi:hypothetical protein